MIRPWHVRFPGKAEEIRADLSAHYPSLHLFIEAHGRAEVRGTFPVLGEAGRVLDRFQVAIELPLDFPRQLPIVRETGGRIPWTLARHVISDGTACVLLPDDRWRSFPIGMPFIVYLRGPLHNFFLSQVVVEVGNDWPFGEWGHGVNGIFEYYYEILETADPGTVLRYLAVLKRAKLQVHRMCSCGSGKPIRDCCRRRIEELRRRVSPETARQSFRAVEHALSESVPRRTRDAQRLLRVAGRSEGL